MSQSLSFPDQSHINRIRDALWERPNGRASIMVGAGFSRNATSIESDMVGIPLWRDIAREMYRRLYPQYAVTDTVTACDALRFTQDERVPVPQSVQFPLCSDHLARHGVSYGISVAPHMKFK